MIRLRVKEMAKERGMSMGRLGRLANIDMSTMKRLYDDSKYNPSLFTIYRIAKALSCTIDELVEENPDEEPVIKRWIPHI